MSNLTFTPQAGNLYDANKQWMNRPQDERFETLDALDQVVSSRRMRSRSTDIDLTRISVQPGEGDGSLIVNSNIAPCLPTYWSFGQLAASVRAPASYLRTLPTDLVAQCFKHGLANATRAENKFMTIASEDGLSPNTLQAVTSPSYGRIWDADCVHAVQRIVERSNGKFYNPKDWNQKASGLYASDHDVFMFMIDGGSMLDVGPRAKLNRGFIVWNSETGAKTFGLMTFLFNVVCGNHIIWNAQDVTKLLIRHTSGGPGRFDADAMPTLKAYVESSAAPEIETIKRAQDYLLEAPKDVKPGTVEALMAFCGKHGKFTRSEVSEAHAFAKSEEGECRTLWQAVQGFTAYARGFDYVDARVDLEKRAGKLLDLAKPASSKAVITV